MAETKTKPKSAPKAAERQEEHAAHVCNVAFCPVGMALTAAQGAAPEAVEHLLAAGRELLLAAKAVVDARAAGVDPKAGQAKLQKIEIA